MGSRLEFFEYSADWLVGTAITKLRRPEYARLMHACGNLAGSIQGPWMLMLYAQTLGLPVASVTRIQFINKLVDMVIDPLVAVVSDGLRTRLGRRHPFMLMAILPLVFSKFSIWHPPPKEAGEDVIWWHLFWFTLLRNIGSTFWGTRGLLTLELIPDYDERAQFSLRVRVAAMILGNGLKAFTTGVLLKPSSPDAKDGFFNIAGYNTFGTIGTRLLCICLTLSLDPYT